MTSHAETDPDASGRTPPLYDIRNEHDACGMGFIAQVNGQPTHHLVQSAVRALVNLTHRGGVGADSASGDGAGVTVQIPRRLLAEEAARAGLGRGRLRDLAVAMVFLPAEPDASQEARAILEDSARRAGVEVLGWRVVPTDPSVLGTSARDSLPVIEQLLLAPGDLGSDLRYRRALYVSRRRAEHVCGDRQIGAYIASMSRDTVVYKGLMVAPQLSRFYPDLTDPRTESALALFHQRFATNTLPDWRLAQPFRRVAHNGEINTILGNRNWMEARGPDLVSPFWGEHARHVHPVVSDVGSDSASFDEVLDLLVTSGRDVLTALAMMVPEAWENMPGMSDELRAFYAYHACLMEPWDGPAALAFTDGRVAAAAMDRNGLRPARYKITGDGLVVVSSEAGVLELPPGEVVASGRVGPGETFAVDTVEGAVLTNDDVKARVAGRRPYGQWLEKHMHRVDRVLLSASAAANHTDGDSPSELTTAQAVHGYTREETRLVLGPMATTGREPIGSMGDDTPPSVLSEKQRLLYTYFRQRFAQVTNPAIDSIREKIVMSLDVYLGRRRSLLDEPPEAARLVHLSSPVLEPGTFDALREGAGGLRPVRLDATFAAGEGAAGLSARLGELAEKAAAAVESGCDLVVLSDRDVTEARAPVPMLLAVSTVHHHLIRAGLRMRASIVADAADARDVHHFAALIGFGASAVHPFLALRVVGALAGEDRWDVASPARAMSAYVGAAEAGIRKIMSKMGISTLASYHGAQIFEALGIGPALVSRCFHGTTSRIGGVELADVASDVLERHARAYDTGALERGGWYRYRRNGDYHANEPPVWRALHDVAQGGDDDTYRTYADLVHARPPTALRDLLDFRPDRESIPLTEVEPRAAVSARFQTGAMSLGALSVEAHEDVARAMGRLGGRANTGEGGEDPRRYLPGGDKRDANAAVKQVASGRFGVTTAYVAGAEELEIKIAQGSKPGEGGQLPGGKVSGYIASLRHVLPGTSLISPPPHHDIYSIEDIAQLIHDLKAVNPDAGVCVKLVASEGVGTIAAGVAKARADVIHISGADGGTGASPLSSVKYAGSPWELGLAETQQTLIMNGLRSRVTLSTDGGLHTGRDVVIAALLGAERFGFGTTALIALGCKMARQCHSDTCPVGIATQAEELRKKYFGAPEMLVAFLGHVAEDVRRILARLGHTRLDDVIGRADLLAQVRGADAGRWRGVDLGPVVAAPRGTPRRRTAEGRQEPGPLLDDRILRDAGRAIEDGAAFQGSYRIRNTDRSVGARISGLIAGRRGDRGLPPSTVRLQLEGSAGQSFGAWLVEGVRLDLTGEANDYVAKGMGGGEISIRPHREVGVPGGKASLVGNTVLYGATGGRLFVAGRAGERFAVRNSGASAVVEGVGDHGCEYMTGGVVVVLGDTGRNFGAGMSGGTAYVLDREGTLPSRLNRAVPMGERVSAAEDVSQLRRLIERHHDLTGSPRAGAVLRAFRHHLRQFVKISPAGAGATPRAGTARAGRRAAAGSGRVPAHGG